MLEEIDVCLDTDVTLPDLNQDQPNIVESMTASSEFLINNNADSLQYENLLRKAIPDSSILNSQIAFVNGQPVEICYIDEVLRIV